MACRTLQDRPIVPLPQSASRKRNAISRPEATNKPQNTNPSKTGAPTNLPKPTSSFKVVQASHSGPSSLLSSSSRQLEDEKLASRAQKASEQRAIDTLNTLKWVSALSEEGVDRQTLKDASHHLKPADYREDVIMERHSSGLCGYPLCDNAPRRVFTSSDDPQFQICLARRKVVDVKESGQFCSTTCYRRSEWYEDSILGREPEWAKALDQKTLQAGVSELGESSQDIKLLEEIEEEHATNKLASAETPMASSSIVMDELMATPLRSSTKEDLYQMLVRLTITEHAPVSSNRSTDVASPSSPRQSALDCDSSRDLSPMVIKSKKPARHVKWAVCDSLSDDDQPLLKAETYKDLGKMIKQQSVLTSSKPGSFQSRSQSRAQVQTERAHGRGDENEVGCGWQSEVVYNVESEEDRLALDWAMGMRNQLKEDAENAMCCDDA